MRSPSIGFSAHSPLFLLAVVLSAAMVPIALRAQNTIADCFGGRPLPCQTYAVFDMIVSGTVAGNAIGGGEATNANGDLAAVNTRWYAGWEIGGMKNVSQSVAMGITGEAGFVDLEAPRIAIKARERTWLPKGMALDIAVGGVRERIRDPNWVYADCGTCDEQKLGVTADATLGTRTIGVTFSADAVSDYGRMNTVFRIGGRAGGIPGLGSTLVAVTVVGAWVAVALAALH